MTKVENLPVDRIMVEVPIDSPEYQAFLEANRSREQAREEHGGPDSEAEQNYRDAIRKLSEFVRDLYARIRAS